MKITDGTTLECKSSSLFWVKEHSYKKRNTVRSIRDLRLDGYTIEQVDICKKIGFVEILNCSVIIKKVLNKVLLPLFTAKT